MRLATTFALAALIALGLASCGESSNSQSRPSATIQLDFATTTQQATPQTCSSSAIPSNIISNMQEFEDLERQLATSVDSFLADPDDIWITPLWRRDMEFAASNARRSASNWAAIAPPACSTMASTLIQTALTMESLDRAWRALTSALAARDNDALQEAAAWLDELDQDLRQIACDHAAADGVNISVLPRC